MYLPLEKHRNMFIIKIDGRLTQLVECYLDMVKVIGSSPITPTKNYKGFAYQSLVGKTLFIYTTSSSLAIFKFNPAVIR